MDYASFLEAKAVVDPPTGIPHAADVPLGSHPMPFQADIIRWALRRAVRLWTNEGDVVLSPFAGIGSEGVVSLEMGRQFVGFELKESYWRQAVMNLRETTARAASDLFADVGAGEAA